MTLKEELEILRGEPIQVWEGDPMDIPCIETSDPKLLCKHPVVSVHMITYNHEPYIREAIEGVMMQKTDFEFELVIGEDCSTDKTREICFEYQKKYPDKIRVLWWHNNSYQFPHPAGGNSRRNLAHCRGEFIALCEGDDYWIDPLKLQKQVDAMRKHPDVGLCFTGAKTYFESTGKTSLWRGGGAYPNGRLDGKTFAYRYLFGRFRDARFGPGEEGFLMTATIMVQRSVFVSARAEDEIFNWRLSLGDAVLILGMASRSNVFFLPDVTAAYRQILTGVCNSHPGRIVVDSILVRCWFARKIFGLGFTDLPYCICVNYLWGLHYLLMGKDFVAGNRSRVRAMLHGSIKFGLVRNIRLWPCVAVLWIGYVSRSVDLWLSRYFRHIPAAIKGSPLLCECASRYQGDDYGS